MLQNIRIVLVETSHTGNMGSVARAMKTMGLTNLWLVNPLVKPDSQAIALAAGASDVIGNAHIVDTLDEALAGCSLVVGTSARSRTLPWPMLDPRECGLKSVAEAANTPVALVFGRERVGLTNEELQKCHYHVAIAANPEYSSLNLAMAVMQARGFNEEDFARSHPAGALGARLLNKVHHLMRRDDAIPQVALTASVMDAMLELSRTGLGLVAVCDAQQQVQGVFTDGDLRRWLVGGGALTTPVNEAMTVGGTTLQSQSRAIDAKEILMKRKITAAPVVDENGKLTGAINLQDFYQAGII